MATPNGPEKFEFPATNTPIAIFFVIVPTLTTLAIAVSLFKHKLPFYLIAILLVLAAACILLVKEAISHIGDVTIELTPQEIVVRRLTGSASYPWSTIESMKLIDPGATFSDASRDDENRSGIGLFLKVPNRKEAPANDQPDVLVLTRSGEDSAKIIKLFDRMSIVKRNGANNRSGKISPQTGNAKKGFRKTATAA
jgi:hypothetical protein